MGNCFNSRAEMKYLFSSPSLLKGNDYLFIWPAHAVNQTRAPRVGSKTRCCSCEGRFDIASMKYYTRLFSYSYASILAWKLQGHIKINLYNLHNVLMTAKSLGMKEATCHFSVWMFGDSLSLTHLFSHKTRWHGGVLKHFCICISSVLVVPIYVIFC